MTKQAGMNEDKRITVWGEPDKRMTATWKECQDCHTVGELKHADGCTGRKLKMTCNTTQFGPCTFGEWLKKIRDMLKGKGVKTFIAHKPDGQLALYDV